MHKTYISHSEEETAQIAKLIFRARKGNTIFALYGNLGSGKTTFVKALATHMHITQRIISPTFTLVRQYQILHNDTSKNGMLYHLDLYRIDDVASARGLGLEEMYTEKNSIVVLEWAEKLKEYLPKKRLDIYFEHISDSEREITILASK